MGGMEKGMVKVRGIVEGEKDSLEGKGVTKDCREKRKGHCRGRNLDGLVIQNCNGYKLRICLNQKKSDGPTNRQILCKQTFACAHQCIDASK